MASYQEKMIKFCVHSDIHVMLVANNKVWKKYAI